MAKRFSYQVVTWTMTGYVPRSRAYRDREKAFTRAIKMNARSIGDPYAVLILEKPGRERGDK